MSFLKKVWITSDDDVETEVQITQDLSTDYKDLVAKRAVSKPGEDKDGFGFSITASIDTTNVDGELRFFSLEGGEMRLDREQAKVLIDFISKNLGL